MKTFLSPALTILLLLTVRLASLDCSFVCRLINDYRFAFLDKVALDKKSLDKLVLDEVVLDKEVLDKVVLDKVTPTPFSTGPGIRVGGGDAET